MKYLIQEHEVMLIDLLDEKSRQTVNQIFNTNYRPTLKSIARVKENLKLSELKKLMQEKPKGGGWCGK